MPITNNLPDASACQNSSDVKAWIKAQALDLGFGACGFVSVHHPLFAKQMAALNAWITKGCHGQLSFLTQHHDLRAEPARLVAGARTILSVRLDYLATRPTPRHIDDNARPNHAIIARYARGRDYHKTVRGLLKKLAQRIQNAQSYWKHLNINADMPLIYRPFADSAPIFERAIAEAAGLGFTGKNTLMIDKKGGSFFVLGELFLSLDLPDDTAVLAHCGSCTACIDICPTRAIVAPYTLDARACISYLTIEHQGVIDERYRRAIGNRVFGCDDCQLICPWNKFAKITTIDDFLPRHGLDDLSLNTLWHLSEDEFLARTEGSPLRRTGYTNILRNTAIAMGNSANGDFITPLSQRLGQSDMLDEHIHWAIHQLNKITVVQT